MKSSTGKHYLALDHLRAFAAFIVFSWHFTHATNGYPIPFEYIPGAEPFSILDEGHTGVALFMTLSGYLFAKLLAGKQIDYRLFIYNRALRLLPLLGTVIVVVGTTHALRGSLFPFVEDVLRGVLLPTLPNGGWSITVEFHFYLLLPFLLFLARKSTFYLAGVVAAAIMFRFFCHCATGSVQKLAYWTIIGRIDQFVLGMLAAYCFQLLRNKNLLALLGALSLSAFYSWFNAAGGFYNFPSYPSPSVAWIVLPTIEGACYALLIGWYDHWQKSTGLISLAIGKVVEYSYSIYLLHFFVVFDLAHLIHSRIADISNFYTALLWCLPSFGLVALMSGLSYHFIELPFLKHRRNYLKTT